MLMSDCRPKGISARQIGSGSRSDKMSTCDVRRFCQCRCNTWHYNVSLIKKIRPGRNTYRVDITANIAGPIKFPNYRIAPQKSLSRPTIYRQKSAPPGGRFFAGKLSAGGDFSGGRFYNGAPVRQRRRPGENPLIHHSIRSQSGHQHNRWRTVRYATLRCRIQSRRAESGTYSPFPTRSPSSWLPGRAGALVYRPSRLISFVRRHRQYINQKSFDVHVDRSTFFSLSFPALLPASNHCSLFSPPTGLFSSHADARLLRKRLLAT